MRFSIRDMLLLTVIVALVLGWWLDHRRMVHELRMAHLRQAARAIELQSYGIWDSGWNLPYESGGGGSGLLDSLASTPNPPNL